MESKSKQKATDHSQYTQKQHNWSPYKLFIYLIISLCYTACLLVFIF